VTRAEHDIPSNREAPIAAELWLADAACLPIRASFDFRQTGPQTWDIRVDTDRGPVLLSSGGARLMDGDKVLIESEKQEYPALYHRFAELTAQGACDVDLSPLQLVADAFLLSRARKVEEFEDRT
jgi:D-galactose 1-dehydrogenase